MGGTFVGFGFGAIQGGLFLPSAFASGNFDRLVVAEIDSELVAQIRRSGGTYQCNVAEAAGLRTVEVSGLEAYNPLVDEDRVTLLEAISEAAELCTALPSFTLYDSGDASVAALLAEGLGRKVENTQAPSAVVYAAENDARAAARLREACLTRKPSGFGNRVVFSETVIAKMCSVVTDSSRIRAEGLAALTEGSSRALLVEAYDKILIDESVPPGFERGLDRFIPKADLGPYALTKFFGHNAIHATLGFLARDKGMSYMHEVRESRELLTLAKRAFVEEAGVGLRKEYAEVEDDLFTPDGFLEYADDALERMINPFLRDPVARVTRDPIRKLGWEDRMLGSMRLAIRAGTVPAVMARAARIALGYACRKASWDKPDAALRNIWSEWEESDEKSLCLDLLLSSS